MFFAKPFDADKLVSALVVDFARPEDRPTGSARWTVTPTSPDTVALSLAGHVRPADMRAAVAALGHHLEQGPRDVVVDLSGLWGFAPSVGSVAKRAVWERRHHLRSVRVMGGSRMARMVSAAACRVLGVPCTLD